VSSERRPGGQPGNMNRITRGTTVKQPDRYGLVIAELGRRYANIRDQVKRQRRHLERCVIEREGKVSVSAAYHLDAACMFQMISLVLRREFKEANGALDGKKLTGKELSDLLAKIGWAVEKRNGALKRLKLDEIEDTEDKFYGNAFAEVDERARQWRTRKSKLLGDADDDLDDEPGSAESHQDGQDGPGDESPSGTSGNASGDGLGDESGDYGEDSDFDQI